MSDKTRRFELPFILPGQAQKELFHNEALVRIDFALQATVEQAPLNAPPLAPEEGQCWIVGADPEAEWDGRVDQLAGWTSGGWRFIAPEPGMTVWNKVAGYPMRWNEIQWSSTLAAASISIGGVQVVGERQSSIASPSGGTVIDAEARACVAEIIAALQSHGLIE